MSYFFPSIKTTVFEVPTRIVLGVDSARYIAKEVTRLSGNNIFFITDKNLEKMGIIDQIKNIFQKEGFKLTIFDSPVLFIFSSISFNSIGRKVKAIFL